MTVRLMLSRSAAAAALLAASGLLGLAGCGVRDTGVDRVFAESETLRRRGQLARTIHQVEANERIRPEQLDRTLALMGRQFEQEKANTARNAARLDAFFRHEFDRWQERQPLYHQWLGEALGGKSAAELERTAVTLFN